MILAGMALKSLTPWWDDPPVGATAILLNVISACHQHHVEPVGTLVCSITDSRFDDDQALRWEFTPAHA